MPELTGKIAFVTGGSRGIGAAIVRRLAADGANVAFTYVSPSSAEGAQALARELSTDGRRALAIRPTPRTPAPSAGDQQAIAELGPVDVLVNNAGVFITGPIGEARLDDYERTMDINVRAPFVAIQAAQAVMPDGGRIINIGSCLAARAGRPGVALYSASKAALVGPDARPGARPGPARHHRQRGAPRPDRHRHESRRRRARGRPGRGAGPAALRRNPRRIAGMVAFLPGPEGRYITEGASLAVDGGFAA